MGNQNRHLVLFGLLPLLSHSPMAHSSSYERLNRDGLLVIYKESFISENMYRRQSQRSPPILQIKWNKEKLDQSGLSPFARVLSRISKASAAKVPSSIIATENSLELNSLEEVSVSRGPRKIYPILVEIKGASAGELLYRSAELGESQTGVKIRQSIFANRELLQASHSSFVCSGWKNDINSVTCKIRLLPLSSKLGVTGVMLEDRVSVNSESYSRDRNGRLRYLYNSFIDTRYSFALTGDGKLYRTSKSNKETLAFPASNSEEVFGRRRDRSELQQLPTGVHVTSMKVSRAAVSHQIQLSINGGLANTWLQTLETSFNRGSRTVKNQVIDGVKIYDSYADLWSNISTRCQISSTGVSQCSSTYLIEYNPNF
jgi:hypothetical protein